MQVVIDIDEKDYNDIINDNPRNLNLYERMIKNGIVIKDIIIFKKTDVLELREE